MAAPIGVRWAGAGFSGGENYIEEIPRVIRGRLNQCACGVVRVCRPGWPRGAEARVGTFIRKHEAALASREHTAAGRAASVITGRKLHATNGIRTAINRKGHGRSRATGSGGARRSGDRSKGVPKRTGPGNPVARTAHIDSGWLRRGPAKHRKIGPVIAGSCQMEIHRAHSHGSIAARVNLNRTRGASEHGD